MKYATTYKQNPNPNKYKHSLRLLHSISGTRVEYSYFKDFCIYGKGLERKKFLEESEFVRVKQANAQSIPVEYYVSDEARTMIMFRFSKEDKRTEPRKRHEKSISQMKYWNNPQGLYP